MKKNKSVYYIINIAFLLGALFFVNYSLIFNNFSLNFPTILLAITLFIVIHIVRFARMYFILLEDLINPNRFLQLYIKTSFVSTLIPFKIGELFKMYCYSVETNSSMKGIIAVLIEKFFDAMILCIFMIPYAFINNNLNPLLMILLIFIVIVLVVYFSFEGTYQYLNRFLICRGGGKKSLTLLKILEAIKKTVDGTKRTLQGRFSLLFFLSLIAWCTEGILLITINSGEISFNFTTLFSYVNDAFFGTENYLFSYYSCLCAIIFSITMLIIYGKKYYSLLRKKGAKCQNL